MVGEKYPLLHFSVVIPTRNEEKSLPGLLSSIKKQTIQPEEIIIADADSKDSTRKIARDNNCVIVDGGASPASARNKGVKRSTSDIIIFFDADTYLPDSNFMESVTYDFSQKRLDIGMCFAQNTPSNGLLGHVVIYAINIRRVIDFIAYKLIKTVVGGSGWFIITYKKVFQNLGGFDEKYVNYEDTDFMKRAASAGYRLGLLPYSLYISGRRYDKMNLTQFIKTSFYIFLYKLVVTIHPGKGKEFLAKYEKTKGHLGG